MEESTALNVVKFRRYHGQMAKEQLTSERRSIRIGKVASSLRLELFFWTILEHMARESNVALSELITHIYLDYVELDAQKTGFASFLRVTVGQYLESSLKQEIVAERTDQTD